MQGRLAPAGGTPYSTACLVKLHGGGAQVTPNNTAPPLTASDLKNSGQVSQAIASCTSSGGSSCNSNANQQGAGAAPPPPPPPPRARMLCPAPLSASILLINTPLLVSLICWDAVVLHADHDR